MRKINLSLSPEKAISLDNPVVTVKSHINYHGIACTEIEIKSINKITSNNQKK